MSTVAATGHRRAFTPWTLPLAALLLTAIVALPPLIGINRFQRTIADSISQGIGRPVRMSSVKMRLLPRPGFEIADFEVEEDPAFGAEPIMRAAEVTAYIRLLPLWRGRLEIARIAFDEPSVNLVRNRQGRWNFDSLVSQAAQLQKAPTGQPHAGSLPRFPYIDANDARINFKFGDEKMPFSFFNADLAVWLENPGQWRVEFTAQPVRTDLSLDLANTGIVKINGSLRRASTLTQMPGVLHAEWTHAPLGQLSRLLAGSDANWRGEFDFTADVSGSADHASVNVAATGRDIHRIEFEPLQPLNMDVSCNAQFTRQNRSFDAITCLAPAGDGHLLLTGSVHSIASRPDPALSLEVNNMPVAMGLDALRLVRSGFAPTARAAGRVDGNFTYSASPGSSSAQLHGGATVNGATMAFPSLAEPLVLPALRLAMSTDAAPLPRRRVSASSRKSPPALVEEPSLLLQPFTLGAPGSLSIGGIFNRSGFRIHAGGGSSVEQAVAIGQELSLLHSRRLSFSPKGKTDMDLTFQGPWMRPVTNPEHPVAAVDLDGSLTIHNAEVKAEFLAQPLEILSAKLSFAQGSTRWNASSLAYGPIHAEGSFNYSSLCQAPADCAPYFTLHVASLDAAATQGALLGAARHGELLQGLIDRFGSDKRAWPAMSGTVAVGALTIGTLIVKDVDAAVKVDGNTIGIQSLTGRTLDGSVSAAGAVSTSGNSPQYQVNLSLVGASASSLAEVFGETWGSGTIDLKTHLKFSGFQAEQLLTSATGTFHANWSNGGLPALAEKLDAQGRLAASPLGHFDSWIADGVIAKNALSLEKSQVSTGRSETSLTGIISFARELDLSESGEAETGNPVKITGTLQAPEVTKANAVTIGQQAP